MAISPRLLVTFVMFALFAGMAAMALGMPEKTRFMPLLVAVPGAVLCLVQIIVDLLPAKGGKAQAAHGEEHDEEVSTARAELLTFIWLGLFFLGILGFGFVVGGTVMVFAYLRFAGHEGWITSLIGGAAVLGVFFFVFGRLLEIILFEGLILGMFL